MDQTNKSNAECSGYGPERTSWVCWEKEKTDKRAEPAFVWDSSTGMGLVYWEHETRGNKRMKGILMWFWYRSETY